MSKFGRKGRPPAGFEYLEPTLDALERELRDRVNDPHEGKRRVESLWPVHQINWQRSRYVYDMYYRYKKISKAVFDYCVRNKIIDGPLCAKWRKPGYDRLCSTYVINSKNFNFGSVSICRVPRHSLGEDQVVECPTTGCRGCATGSGPRNIFGNKYGQFLARIQIERERRRDDAAELGTKRKRNEDADVVGREPQGPSIWAEDDDDDDDDGPMPADQA